MGFPRACSGDANFGPRFQLGKSAADAGGDDDHLEGGDVGGGIGVGGQALVGHGYKKERRILRCRGALGTFDGVAGRGWRVNPTAGDPRRTSSHPGAWA